MGKVQYLNSSQKFLLTMCIAASQFLERSVELEAKIPSEASANLKRGRTFVKKGVDQALEAIDDKTARSILNIIHDNTIGIIASSPRNKVADAQDEYLRDKEFADRLAERAMSRQSCEECDGSPNESGCPLREALIHFSVPPWDELHPSCEYAQAGGVEE